MNQDAGLQLSAGSHEKNPRCPNLEDVATGDIIVVKEIALDKKIGVNISSWRSKVESADIS